MLSYHLLSRLLMPDADSPENALKYAVSSAVNGLLPHDLYVDLARTSDARTLSAADLESRMATLLRNDCNPLLDLVALCESAAQFVTQWNTINAELPLGVVTRVSTDGDGVQRTCRSGHDSELRENIMCALIEQLGSAGKPELASPRALRRIAKDVRPTGDLVAELLGYLFQAPGADLPECVAELGCSKRTLQRELRLAGLTFVASRSAVRLSVSKEQLRDTSESMTAVALSAGFYDSAHFCHSFRLACGISPSRFRTFLRRSLPGEMGTPAPD